MNTDPNIPTEANEFAGKRVLVTGGTKGMGEAIVKRLARGGAIVISTARSAALGAPASDLFIPADLSTAEGTEKVVRETLDRFRRRGHSRQQRRRLDRARWWLRRT